MRILLVEDDVNLAKSVALHLKNMGILVDIASSIEEGVDHTDSYKYDLILLDIMLPDGSGLDFLKSARSNNLKSPVIMLTGMGDLDLKVEALNAGADDYITKPFSKDELLARINAIVRRSKGEAASVLLHKTSNLTINLLDFSVSVSGQSLYFTHTEYKILELLMLNKGSVVSREDIMNYIYDGTNDPGMKIIDVFLYRIRKKLSTVITGDIIESIPNRGVIIKDN